MYKKFCNNIVVHYIYDWNNAVKTVQSVNFVLQHTVYAIHCIDWGIFSTKHIGKTVNLLATTAVWWFDGITHVAMPW